MSDRGAFRERLLARALEGPGETSPGQRREAYDGTGPAPLETLVGKVGRHAYRVTDADVATAVDALGSEEAVMELVVCAALGAAQRQHDAAYAAIAEWEGR